MPPTPLPHTPAGLTDVPADAPRVVLPDDQVFQRRAERLMQLAAAHGMAEWLQLMAALAQAQHAALPRRAASPVDPELLQHSREHAMPPLSSGRHARDAKWREDLDDLMAQLADVPAAATMLSAVNALDPDAREALADRLLAGDTLDVDAAAVPLIGAALQVAFARAAAALDSSDVERFDAAAVCPVCASRPQASVLHQGGVRDKLRYLACALCSTEWKLPRIQCSACLSEKSVHFLALTPVALPDDVAAGANPAGKVEAEAQPVAADEGGDSAGKAASPEAADEAAAAAASEQSRRAEVCDECKTYLKIFYRNKDTQVDVMADDLASLALDVAVSDRGYGRSGPNLLLHVGQQ